MRFLLSSLLLPSVFDSSILQFTSLPPHTHPTVQGWPHKHRRKQWGTSYSTVRGTEDAGARIGLDHLDDGRCGTISTKKQQIGTSNGQWWQSKGRWRSRSRLLQIIGQGRNGWSSGSGRAFPGLAMRQNEESSDRCHVGDAVCGGGDAQPRETTLTAQPPFPA